MALATLLALRIALRAQAASVPADSIARPRAPLVATPADVRGLYVDRWAALGPKVWQLTDVARTTEANALVIDVKHDRGFVLHRSRVVVAKDPLLTTTKLEWAIRSRSDPSKPWLDKNG